MADLSPTPAAQESRDAWGIVTLGLTTIGICVLAPRVAYEVLYRCNVPEIQTAINDEKTRAILFLYITIGTVFTACISSFMGSFPIMVSGSGVNIRRIVGTIQCLASLLVIVFFFMLGPPQHKINLDAFITPSKEFVFFIPMHYLTLIRGILAILSAMTAIIESWRKLVSAVNVIKGRLRKQKS